MSDPSFRSVVQRQALHAANATWGVLAYHFVVPRGLAIAAVGALTAAFGVMEALRLRVPSINRQVLSHPVFGRVIRPHEVSRVSGGFWFGLGVFLSLVLWPRPAVEAGCLAMGFGDAAATVVGRRFGTIRLHGGRTLQGTLAFLVATFTVVVAFRALLYPDGLASACAWAAVAGAAGAVVETLSGRLDDNLTIPVVTSGLLAWAFGA